MVNGGEVKIVAKNLGKNRRLLSFAHSWASTCCHGAQFGVALDFVLWRYDVTGGARRHGISNRVLAVLAEGILAAGVELPQGDLWLYTLPEGPALAHACQRLMFLEQPVR